MVKHNGDTFGVVNGSLLTDADWIEINHLKALYQSGGREALFSRVIHLKANQPARYVAVWGALFPSSLREAVKDAMASQGIDEDDLRQLVREHESPASDQ